MAGTGKMTTFRERVGKVIDTASDAAVDFEPSDEYDKVDADNSTYLRGQETSLKAKNPLESSETSCQGWLFYLGIIAANLAMLAKIILLIVAAVVVTATIVVLLALLVIVNLAGMYRFITDFNESNVAKGALFGMTACNTVALCLFLFTAAGISNPIGLGFLIAAAVIAAVGMVLRWNEKRMEREGQAMEMEDKMATEKGDVNAAAASRA